jgi:hypothetical protein
LKREGFDQLGRGRQAIQNRKVGEQGVEAKKGGFSGRDAKCCGSAFGSSQLINCSGFIMFTMVPSLTRLTGAVAKKGALRGITNSSILTNGADRKKDFI